MARKLAIVRPLPFTIAGVQNITNSGNLLTPDPKEVATAAASVSCYVDIDLGSAQSIDTIFIGFVSSNFGTVIPTGGTVSVADFNLAGGSLPGQASVLVNPAYHRVNVESAPVTARYLRFNFSSVASVRTLGVLAVGLSVPIIWGHEFGSGRPIEDTGSAERLFSGGFGIYDGVTAGGYQWTFGDLYDSEVEALYALQRDRGTTRSLLVIEDPTQSSGLNERTHWGLLDRLEVYERGLPGASKYALKVRDWA